MTIDEKAAIIFEEIVGHDCQIIENARQISSAIADRLAAAQPDPRIARYEKALSRIKNIQRDPDRGSGQWMADVCVEIATDALNGTDVRPDPRIAEMKERCAKIEDVVADEAQARISRCGDDDGLKLYYEASFQQAVRNAAAIRALE